jgi:hypothetical protein
MGHIDHAARVTRVQDRAGLVPGTLIGVLDTEGLHLKPNNASQVGLDILVVEDGEPQVVVKEELDLSLALMGQRGERGDSVVSYLP